MIWLKLSILDYLSDFKELGLVLYGFSYGYFCIFTNFFRVYICKI